MQSNLNILIFVESRYKVNRKRIKSALSNLLNQQGVNSPVEVSVAIVGDRKMRQLSKKYKGEGGSAKGVCSISKNQIDNCRGSKISS